MAADKASLVFFAFACLWLENVHAAGPYKVCASPGKIALECQALERGSSTVSCVSATDSVDCLLKMEQDLADFVVLTAEETILAATAQPERYNVLASVRHEDRRYQHFAFQSVAVVRADHTGGLSGLANGGLCHPGYGKGKEQLWSDRVLKYFEKKTASASRKCVSGSKSSAEDDANELNNFFSGACRPGPWLLDSAEDKKLKLKFPKLCSLCTLDGTADCDGYRYFEPRAVPGVAANSHLSAMECLTSNKGNVAYVAYNHVVDYFKSKTSEVSKFALLCENGTVVPLAGDLDTTTPPCAWVKQPWAALVARKSISADLQADLRKWMPQGRADNAGSWVDSLDAIIFKEKSDVMEYLPSPITPANYIIQGRPIPTSETNPCHKTVRWCTVSAQEQSKCGWVRSAALTVGLLPEITCVRGSSHIDCLDQVQKKRADFVGIDTNLGYLARKHYEQTAVVYSETTRAQTSRVLALVKNINDSSITRFENTRDKNACFPEYGGIAWAAFVRVARERKVIDAKACDYAGEVARFFSAACAPGARDPAHFPSKTADPQKLCSGCKGFSPRGASGANEAGVVALPAEQECPADFSNSFFGTTGALRCLSQPDSNVAFIEGQYLKAKAHNLNLKEENFRVLCRNGSLAVNPGFDVEESCALSVTIDGEVVARRDYEDRLSLQLLIQELDTWFGYNSGTVSLINLQIFSPFNNTKDLLFKDSTIGVATNSSDNEFVRNYIELHEHTDKCSGAAALGAMLPAVLALLLATRFWLL